MVALSKSTKAPKYAISERRFRTVSVPLRAIACVHQTHPRITIVVKEELSCRREPGTSVDAPDCSREEQNELKPETAVRP